MLVENVELANARIVDIGASDGSTSVDLISKVINFKAYIIADLFFDVTAVAVGKRIAFFDNDDQWILVVGPKCLAWPSLSWAVSKLYARTQRAARASRTRQQVLLLNPTARSLIESDDRVSYRVHDVFKQWEGERPDVVKVANLLRRLYFSDSKISEALLAILGSLEDGGYLLIVDNPRISGIAERAGLYRRDNGRFVAVKLTPDTPEIDDLVTSVRLSRESRS